MCKTYNQAYRVLLVHQRATTVTSHSGLQTPALPMPAAKTLDSLCFFRSYYDVFKLKINLKTVFARHFIHRNTLQTQDSSIVCQDSTKDCPGKVRYKIWLIIKLSKSNPNSFGC